MLQWIALAALVLACPIKQIRPHLFKPYIREAEEARDVASFSFAIVKHATDEEKLHVLGRTWYRAILWKARLPVYMDSFGFPDATLFDYLNPWSDLRIALDDILPHMLKAMKQEIQMLKFVAVAAPKQLGYGRRIYSTPMCWPQSVQRRWSSERLTKAHSKGLKQDCIATATPNRNAEVD